MRPLFLWWKAIYSKPDFSDLRKVDIAYTTITDEEVPVQVSVDLVDFRLDRSIDGIIVDSRKYDSLKELTEQELVDPDFDELVIVHRDIHRLIHATDPNTIAVYLNLFQLDKKALAKLNALRVLAGQLVSEFLDWLETSRHIAVTTRNQRLAAIKAFAHFVQYRFPENMENCVDIINLRPKKHEKPLIPFLTEDDLSVLLAQPDASTRQGLRDLALLALLYDSGARVQELVDLKLKDIRLTHPAMVVLTGKGRKSRQVPLMKDTCKLMDRYIRAFHPGSQSQLIPLFYNAEKQALSRYGVTYILKKYAAKASPVLEPQKISPHVLRHTKAMHLLRAGVNMIYIRDFLGHADISTTEVYARIDAEMKRKVFEEKVPNYTPNTTMPWEEDENLLQWLTQFGKRTF